MSDAKPYSKSDQLGRGPQKKPRYKANKKKWEQLRAAKDGPCRVCRGAPPNELHHLVPRSQGGDDVCANLVPLCHRCHERVTRYDREACAELRKSLTWRDPRSNHPLESGDEYTYVVGKMGEGWLESRYPVKYEAA